MQERKEGVNPVISLTFPLISSVSLSSFSVTRWPSAPSPFTFPSPDYILRRFSTISFPSYSISSLPFSRISSALFIVWRPLRSPLMPFCEFACALFRDFVPLAPFLQSPYKCRVCDPIETTRNLLRVTGDVYFCTHLFSLLIYYEFTCSLIYLLPFCSTLQYFIWNDLLYTISF